MTHSRLRAAIPDAIHWRSLTGSLTTHFCEAEKDALASVMEAALAQQTPHAAGGELRDEFVEELEVTWKEYALCPDEQLTPEAQKLKRDLIETVVRCNAALAAQTSPTAGEGRSIADVYYECAEFVAGHPARNKNVDEHTSMCFAAIAGELRKRGAAAEHPQPAPEGERET